MKIKTFSTLVLFFIIASIFLFLYRSGIFYPVKIEEKESSEMILVLNRDRDSGKEETIEKISSDLKRSFAVDSYRGFGLFYNSKVSNNKSDPVNVKGCIIRECSNELAERIKKKYRIIKLPKTRILYAVFPYRSKLSVILGKFKFYPRFREYAQNRFIKERPVMEVYDFSENKIEFMVPFCKDYMNYRGLLN